MGDPNNERLARAIELVLDSPAEEMGTSFRAMLEALIESTLVAGDDGGEPRTIYLEGEEELLVLFTNVVELFAFDAGARAMELGAEEAIRLVAAGDYDGLVINPAGRALELSREDVLEMLEIDGLE